MTKFRGETTLPSFIRIELVIPTELVESLGDKIYSLITNEGFSYEKDRWHSPLTTFALSCSINMDSAINFFDNALDLYAVVIEKLHFALKNEAIAHELLFYWIPLRFSENEMAARNFSTLQHHWMFCIERNGPTITDHFFKYRIERPEIFCESELKDIFNNELSKVQRYISISEKVRNTLEQDNQQSRRDVLMAIDLLEGTGD